MPALQPPLFFVGAVAIALFSAAAPTASGQSGRSFRAPNFEKPLFDNDSILLERGELQTVTSALAALASNFQSHPKVTPDLRARALAIALRLDGVHRPSRLALDALQRGQVPRKVDGYDQPAEAARVLWNLAATLDTDDAGPDDWRLACYLSDIAVRVDSDPDRAALERYQRMALAGDFKAWAGVVAGGGGGFDFPNDPAPEQPEPPAGEKIEPPPLPVEEPSFEPGTLAKKQSAGRMLGIDSQQRPVSGVVVSMGASAIEGETKRPMKLVFLDDNKEKVPGLVKPATFIPAAMTARGYGWPENGGEIAISLDGPFNPANREGIALPAALLTASLTTGKEYLPAVVATGGIGEDGSVTAVRNLLARLRGVTPAEAQLVLVPEGNLPQLYDLALMGRLDVVLKYQIFSAGDLNAAVGIALDQTDDLKRARLLFSSIQDLTESSDPAELASSKSVRSRLTEVLALAPNHASAKVLIAAGGGALPAKMSREGSLFAIEQAAMLTLKTMAGGADPVIDDSSVFSETRSALSSVRAKLDRDCVGLSDDVGELVEHLETYSKLNNRTSTRGKSVLADLRASWGRVRSTLRSMHGEQAPAAAPQPRGADESS